MKKKVLIIDPLSSGSQLAKLFNERGVECIAVKLSSIDIIGYGTKIDEKDFTKIISLEDISSKFMLDEKFTAIISGTDRAVEIVDQLIDVYLPKYKNISSKKKIRLDKGLMQEELRKEGVECLKTLRAENVKEIENWIVENQMEGQTFVMKPPSSAGSDNVFHVSTLINWKEKFELILDTPSKITGNKSDYVIVQEEAHGTEYAFGTVSQNGEHILSHIIKYNKCEIEGRKTIYNFVEFVDISNKEMRNTFSYVKKVLDVLGVKWGANHTEVFITKNGARLIETSNRMCGGPVVEFSKFATGSSQAEKLVELFVDGEVKHKDFKLHRSIYPVFLRASKSGYLQNGEIFDNLLLKSDIFKKYLWFQNNQFIKKTVDYLTSIGIIALSGPKDIVANDINQIRMLESSLVYSELKK